MVEEGLGKVKWDEEWVAGAGLTDSHPHSVKEYEGNLFVEGLDQDLGIPETGKRNSTRILGKE